MDKSFETWAITGLIGMLFTIIGVLFWRSYTGLQDNDCEQTKGIADGDKRLTVLEKESRNFFEGWNALMVEFRSFATKEEIIKMQEKVGDLEVNVKVLLDRHNRNGNA